jgi:hypothetical protein
MAVMPTAPSDTIVKTDTESAIKRRRSFILVVPETDIDPHRISVIDLDTNNANYANCPVGWNVAA